MSDFNVNVSAELPSSVDNALKNVTDLPSKSVGQTLSDCWFLAFGGISQLAEKRRLKYAHSLEVYKNELETSLSQVPPEFKREPSTQIVLKTLEESKNCVEEKELRELFVKLLTSASDSRKFVHPSFPQIISQMSVNDATFLQGFKIAERYPLCNLKHIKDNLGNFNYISENIFVHGSSSMSLEEKALSITSLSRLGLLDIPWDAHLSDSKFYEKFYTSDVYINAKQLYPENELELEKKMVCLTPLGKSFVKCCVPDIVISVTKQ